MSTQPLLTLKDISKKFQIKGSKNSIRAVDGVSLSINPGTHAEASTCRPARRSRA